MDTPDGLLVPVMRDVGNAHAPRAARRSRIASRRGARERTLPAEDLRNFTFMLSNFGMLAGRYATPVVVPPAVAILGTGRARATWSPIGGRVEVHRAHAAVADLRSSLVTGGEAVRFLAALIHDLELPE